MPYTPGSLPDTPADQVDAAVERVAEHADSWAATPRERRAELLRQCLHNLGEVADDWARAVCDARGLNPDTVSGAEPWFSELLPTARNIRLLVDALEADGSKTPKVSTRPDGRHTVRVYPVDTIDSLLLGGVTADVWLEEGAEPTMQTRAAGPGEAGGVTAVMGAGNVGSVAVTDVLHQLFSENRTSVLKVSPVNGYLEPFWNKTFKPLIDEGAWSMVQGGAEVGVRLCNHERVDQVHVTGSVHTYEAIVWGPREGRGERKAKGERVNERPVYAELGNVTPIIVVPGRWSTGELDYQARNVACMVTDNAGFHCTSANVLVLSRDWAQKDDFLAALRRAMAHTPKRPAYYPGAIDRYESLVDAYKNADVVGERGEGVVPWTLVPDLSTDAEQPLFVDEAFCGVLGHVNLPGADPAAFLADAVTFANETLWGTLSCSLIVDKKTEKAFADAVDGALRDLRYGGIGVNIWSGVVFGAISPPWGGVPGTTPQDIQSGTGFVHNTFGIEKPEKTILRAPFRMRPTPPWFHGHRNALKVAERMYGMEADRGWSKLPGVAMAAMFE